MATGSVSPLVIASTIFSLVTLTKSVAGDDAFCLSWSLTDGQTWWKWVVLHLWRVLDIVSKVSMYALFYNSDRGGFVAAVLLAMNLSVGGFVYFLIKFKLRALLCINERISKFY